VSSVCLRLYDYAASGNCYKVRLLLAQLELPYERVPIDIFAGDTLTPEYARINPLRSTPVLELAPGRFLAESNAILVYLAEGTRYMPRGRLERAEVVRWLVYEQSDVVPMTGGLRFRLITGRLSPDDPDAVRRREGGEELLALLDDQLAAREFFVGDGYTIADVSLYSYLHVAHEAGFDLARYHRVASWLERVRGQPRYMNDLEPYPANARPGAGRSIYDAS
jgi:glutathione S-transferase